MLPRMEHEPRRQRPDAAVQATAIAEAFETLYRRHNDALYRYLLRLCRNHRDTAEDLFQEVWGKIVKSRERYRPTAKFTTFLYRVAHNCFIDHLRRNQRHSTNCRHRTRTHSAGEGDAAG